MFPLAMLAAAAAFVTYTYVGYPLLLLGVAALRRGRALGRQQEPDQQFEWPLVSITVPAYNEEAQIRGLIESLLRLDYPAEKRQILIVSDASTDRTDAIVAEYAERGVELLRMPQRGGKDAAENAARAHLRGEIIVNTDASIRIDPGALKPMIARFADPTVGLASGRDVSVGSTAEAANAGEAGYVGYEMWVRQLETRLGGIVGASGCFYAIRAELHNTPLADGLSRDFASALITREHGCLAVSVDSAVCYVPRSPSLKREYRRKVRTMSRGLLTLFAKRHLLNPVPQGLFAWMLFSHKLCRWLVPWALVGSVVGVALLAASLGWARWVLAGIAAVLLLAVAVWTRIDRAEIPRLLAVPTFVLASNLAALHAWLRALSGRSDALWEPTRRDPAEVVITRPVG